MLVLNLKPGYKLIENGLIIKNERIVSSFVSDDEEVVIPDFVTKINKQVFSNKDNLKSIYIPKSVIDIGPGQFICCHKLENIEVDIGNPRYKSINNCLIDKETNTLIAGCKTSKLTSEANVIIIGRNAFTCCYNLESIVIPDTVTRIDKYAFSECKGLKKVIMFDSVVSIKEGAFEDCTELEEVVLSKNVKVIHDYVFAGCKKLTKLNIHSGIERLGIDSLELARQLIIK